MNGQLEHKNARSNKIVVVRTSNEIVTPTATSTSVACASVAHPGAEVWREVRARMMCTPHTDEIRDGHPSLLLQCHPVNLQEWEDNIGTNQPMENRRRSFRSSHIGVCTWCMKVTKLVSFFQPAHAGSPVCSETFTANIYHSKK